MTCIKWLTQCTPENEDNLNECMWSREPYLGYPVKLTPPLTINLGNKVSMYLEGEDLELRLQCKKPRKWVENR